MKKLIVLMVIILMFLSACGVLYYWIIIGLIPPAELANKSIVVSAPSVIYYSTTSQMGPKINLWAGDRGGAIPIPEQ